MGTIRDKGEEEVNRYISYYQSEVRRVEKKRETLLEVAELMERVGLGEEEIKISCDTIEFRFADVREAREWVGKILDTTNESRFIKTHHTYAGQLEWGYSLDHKGVMISIYPVEPSRDCIPVKKTNTYTTWVCEEKAGEE